MDRKLTFAVLAIAFVLLALNLLLGQAILAEEPLFDIALLVADTSPPEVQTFELDPRLLDTGPMGQVITVTTSVADFGSGVDGNGGLQVQFKSPSGHQLLDFTFYHGVAGEPDALIDGDERLGLWQSVATLPRSSENGEWCLEYFFLVDKMGNLKTLSYNDMLADGYPASFEVRNTYHLSLPLVIDR